ncbi:ROK family protein [Saccharopolyspora sp. 6V]|uniref:ROK family protein n=1 Tax=Saccharopolyspora sp. 6V TaxID=2877239 RepID=UPI001CD62CCB|nr:ROK family protein [Saccharopolyspora sp. 6V]MCA1194578.1 ROK family protein [Saccharopolyspora sp. 6V]
MQPENAHQARLLTSLRFGGAQAAAELAAQVSLSRSKIGQELARLQELGFVERAGKAASRGGRRSGLVQLSRRLRFVGIDIGATSLDVGVTDGLLDLVAHTSEGIEIKDGPDAVLGRAVDVVEEMRAAGHLPGLHGVGIGVPGPVSFRDGFTVSPPIMPGWDRYPVREYFAQRLGVPALVDNDVNLMALGEMYRGLGRSVPDFLFVKIGTGIGCGIITGNRVLRGSNGSAGDIGHIAVHDTGPVCGCGRTGCLEAWFSGASLSRDATALARSGESPELRELLAGRDVLTAHDVGTAMRHGDPLALGLVREGARRLGTVLAGLVNFANPAMIVVGGGVAGLGHPLLAEVRSELYRRSTPLATSSLPIALSELGGTAGVVGAAGLISDHVLGGAAAP